MIFSTYSDSKILKDLHYFDDNALNRNVSVMHLSDEKPNGVGISPRNLFFANFTPFTDSYHYEHVMRILKAKIMGYDTPANVPADQAETLEYPLHGLVLYWHDSTVLTQALMEWHNANTYEELSQRIPSIYWDKKTGKFYMPVRWGEPYYNRLLNSDENQNRNKFENMLLEWWNRQL